MRLDQIVILSEFHPDAVDPGNAPVASGWFARTLNHVENPQLWATLADDSTFHLEAGSYHIVGSCPAYKVDNFQTRIRRASEPFDTLVVGTGAMTHPSGDHSTSRSFIDGLVLLTERTTLVLEQWCQFVGQPGDDDGLGQDGGPNGEAEVYAQLRLVRLES